jgi:hypothetical protein
MKNIIFSLAILGSSFAISPIALAENEQVTSPSFNCELTYAKKNSAGETIKLQSSEAQKVTVNKGAEITLNGFTLTATIEPVYASDGGPQAGYNANLIIKKDKVLSMSPANLIDGKKGYDYLHLTVGRETADATCTNITQ